MKKGLNSWLEISILTSKRFRILLTLIFAVITSVSLVWNISVANHNMEDRAVHQARGFFDLILTAREWNSLHGGVYVQVDEDIQPNPYLKDPHRDIVLNNILYTKVNPAYMTRGIADLTKKDKQVTLHMTSLKPLNPQNNADDWEYTALNQFEQGSKEYFGFIDNSEEAVFRYAAPLYTEKSCLSCHETQGYKEGDVRGAISITIDSHPMLETTNASKRNIIFIHLLVFLLFTFLTTIFLYYLRRNWQQKQLVEDELRISEEALQTIFDSIHDSVFIHDMNGTIIDVNETMLTMYQMTKRDLKLHPSIKDYVCETQNVELESLWQKVIKGEPQLFEGKARSVSLENEFFVEVFLRGLMWKKQQTILVTVRDITERKQYEQKIIHQAQHDSLTGLPNRRMFEEILNLSIKRAERSSETFAVGFLDLDRFKQINDTLGHPAGDRLLQKVAKRIRSALRGGDVAARLGGDEFSVLFNYIDSVEGVTRAAQRIIDEIAQPFEIEGNILNVTVSIGLSCYPQDGEDMVTLMKNADIALYRSKEAGRNRLTVYQD